MYQLNQNRAGLGKSCLQVHTKDVLSFQFSPNKCFQLCCFVGAAVEEKEGNPALAIS